MKIWLADLTYTQQTIASDTIPAAVGHIGSYVRKFRPEDQIRIFKYPEKLAKALEEDQPEVLGLSNYVWNSSLASSFARAVKKHFPKTTVVMGGPNFPTVPLEQEEVLRGHPEVDFYIMKEAEVAFLELVQTLAAHQLDRNCVPSLGRDLPNLVYIDEKSQFHTSSVVERVRNLAELPSPYMNGDLDEFFDGKLLPIIQTNRGCPFTCAFCTEGQSYWSKVHAKPEEQIHAELEYIAQKLAQIPAQTRRSDLLIADSNFGMFPADLNTCRVIADIQKKYDYPRYINVATGKNKKEQVLEAAKLVNGAMKLAGSVQSLDETVLKNIKRSNISAPQIVEMAMKAAEIGTNTYSEVILALPGDTRDAHFKTLQTLIDAGFNTLSMYQLMILPGTELGSRETKEKFGFKSRYRVVPRCFGYFHFRGEPIVSAEIEEICVENNTLPYADYLNCRRMNLIVNLFYNDGIFSEVLKLIRALGLSQWDWLVHIYEQRGIKEFEEFIGQFLAETERELWEKREDLWGFTQDTRVIDQYIAGELGSNLIFKYKALSMTHYFDFIAQVAAVTIQDFFLAKGVSEDSKNLALEIIRYNHARVSGIFSKDLSPREEIFDFDIARFARGAVEADLTQYRFSEPIRVKFEHSPEQAAQIQSYVDLFGNDIPGLTRILSRVFLKQFFRKPTDQRRELPAGTIQKQIEDALPRVFGERGYGLPT